MAPSECSPIVVEVPAQVPLAQQADLLGGVAFFHHACHEIGVLVGVFGAGLGVERNDRQ